MLSTVEITPSARRVVRRGIEIGCELYSERGGSRRERVLDLSHQGARVSSHVPLRHGEEVLISFVPPGAKDDRVSTFCEVVHSEQAPSLFGLRFLDLGRPARVEIARRLRGVPPPLPRTRKQKGQVWVDALVTWEEDLEDRINLFEISQKLIALDDDEIEPTALSTMLTGGAPYVFQS